MKQLFTFLSLTAGGIGSAVAHPSHTLHSHAADEGSLIVAVLVLAVLGGVGWYVSRRFGSKR